MASSELVQLGSPGPSGGNIFRERSQRVRIAIQASCIVPGQREPSRRFNRQGAIPNPLHAQAHRNISVTGADTFCDLKRGERASNAPPPLKRTPERAQEGEILEIFIPIRL
ncbi:hypothetical protein M408DRAFT_6876 [Serendipita vermifera MAFF 305830]|uniref:Uncharacterized protein n=1 Tax=Serendipita vermifera MAFF 305830 TaxID=933852 RepID=A0A0C3BI92_SERVB|nr:hypothetical protein M408DRAFT_6876 [Serendipita vermifera MAFF 305830]